MASDVITLKDLKNDQWAMFAPGGHQIGPIFKGKRYKAREWASAYISSFKNWSLKEEQNEQEDRIPPPSL